MTSTCGFCKNILPEGDLKFTVNGDLFCSVDCALEAGILNAAIETQFHREDGVVTVLIVQERDETWSKLCTFESPDDRYVFGVRSKVSYETALASFQKEIARRLS